MSNSILEKRKLKRIPISMRIESDTIDPIGFGYAVNISEKGLGVVAEALVHSDSVPAMGSTLKLKFKLPLSDYYISALAQVVYIELRQPSPPQIGFEFKSIPDEALEQIRLYIQSCKE